MKKQKVDYRYIKYDGQVLLAKREIPYEIKLASRLLLDELCFNWNRKRFINDIDHSIDTGDKSRFLELSKMYNTFLHK